MTTLETPAKHLIAAMLATSLDCRECERVTRHWRAAGGQLVCEICGLDYPEETA